MARRTGWLIVSAVALTAGAMLWWRDASLAPLRAEAVALRDQERELAKLRTEQKRLVSQQVSGAELERLRADRGAVERLQREVDGLRARLEAAPKTPVQKKTEAGRLAIGKVVPAAEWKNVGADTPPAALETALWAAAGGDVDAFAGLLRFDVSAKKAAQTLFDRLPQEVRARYVSPEQLVASMSIKDVPLGTAEIRQWSDASEGNVMLAKLALSAPGGAPRDVTLPLVRQGSGWRLFVVERTVAKYAEMLSRPETAKP